MRFLLFFFLAAAPAFGDRIVCYWNGKSILRQDTGHVDVDSIKRGAALCSHLIYGFAAINDDYYTLEPIDRKIDLDTDKGKGQWRKVAELKKSHPGLTIMLSVGGYEDQEDLDKYLKLLLKQERRTAFATSVVSTLREYGFDGIDLAWQFPHVEEKTEKSVIGSIWDMITKAFGGGIDKKAILHRGYFVLLCSELKAELRPENKTLSVSVLPHVNSTTYFDVKSLMHYVDMVNLWTADFRTPERTQNVADYPHPLHLVGQRLPHQNAEAVVRHWLNHGAVAYKLNLGIATWGRTWTLKDVSSWSGIPPLVADGPGEKGPFTKTKGFLAYYEICYPLVSPDNATAPADSLRKGASENRLLGAFAYTLPTKNVRGIWVGYEDPTSAAAKASFAKNIGLGGVAILDLALDNPWGVCEGIVYPITKAARHSLGYKATTWSSTTENPYLG
ncbi:chitinase-like protein EN03 [Halyomorpha halys]|uniref:chitinase-like protein EN03 n=1 Tax=Halyomorpha halys TaxID=286706 RepID=UPI0006D4D585